MDRHEIKIIIGVVLAVAAIIWLIAAVMIWSNREACQEFCEDFGETAYHSATYGCFCVTPEGKRYNPDMLTKDE